MPLLDYSWRWLPISREALRGHPFLLEQVEAVHLLRSVPRSWNAWEMPGPRSFFLMVRVAKGSGPEARAQWDQESEEGEARGHPPERWAQPWSSSRSHRLCDQHGFHLCLPFGSLHLLLSFSQCQLMFSRPLASCKLFVFEEYIFWKIHQ